MRNCVTSGTRLKHIVLAKNKTWLKKMRVDLLIILRVGWIHFDKILGVEASLKVFT